MGVGGVTLPAGLLVPALAGVFFPMAAGGAEGRILRLCNPDGVIRAERTQRGLRIRFVDTSGRSGDIDFTLRGWEIRSGGGKACLELIDRKKEKKSEAAARESEDVLRAKDEMIEYGGAFQDKVIIRRGRRVIEQIGERFKIRQDRIVAPKRKPGPRETPEP